MEPEKVACPGPEKPLCVDAEAQAPRDLTVGATGERPAKAVVLTQEQAKKLPQTNIHFHFGAEHKSEAYSDDTDSKKYDAAANSRRLLAKDEKKVRPGFMCKADHLTPEQLKPYDWKYCEGEMHVGKSYEVHYVHSSAGTPGADLDDGLGSAAGGRGQLNPMVAVQGQVFLIVNDELREHMDNDLVHGWDHTDHKDAVMYAGSTTGQSHDNTVCSPYTVTWHVDKDCHEISASAFDNMCKVMKELYGMENDLHPHGSRIILDPAFVVPEDEVTKY